MSLSDFFYRQKQRLKYHVTTNPLKKRIAEINQHKERIVFIKDGILIKSLNFVLPRIGFEFVFQNRSFDFFIENAQRLNGKYVLVNNKLLFGFDSIQLVITSGSELFIINEIFVEKCYNFRLPHKEKIIVVDVGMNVGLASLFFANHPQVEKVYSYEPFLPTFIKAMANLSLNPTLNNRIISNNFGLGNKNEKILAMYNQSNPGINSTVIESQGDSCVYEERLELKEARQEILNLIEQIPDGKKYIIKIDTEGSEYPIIDSIFSGHLPNSIIGFFIEWHFRGPELLEDRLLNKGFQLSSFNLNKNTGLIYAFR